VDNTRTTDSHGFWESIAADDKTGKAKERLRDWTCMSHMVVLAKSWTLKEV
jgi:hypothetical protein